MKLFKHLFSGWLMGVLLIVFAFVIGYATFIENDHGAEVAKLMVYNTIWFELILLLMVINFSGMIFTKHLYMKGKRNVLLIHLALILIIIGAGVTRYIGFEGQMHIRDGQTTNMYRSTDTYLQVQFRQGDDIYETQDKFILNSIKNNQFSKTYEWKEEPITITVDDYYANSVPTLVSSEGGDAYISMVVGGSDGRHEFSIKEGETKLLPSFGLSFGDTNNTELVSIIRDESNLFIRFPDQMMAKISGLSLRVKSRLSCWR